MDKESRRLKVRLRSIADRFDRREPDLPPLAAPFTGKPMQRDMRLE